MESLNRMNPFYRAIVTDGFCIGIEIRHCVSRYCDPFQVSALWIIIIHRIMLAGTVVPYRNGTRLPFQAELVFRYTRLIVQYLK